MSQDPAITELQEQLAFQEQTIDNLNASLSQQQLDMARLQRSLELLAQQVKNMRQHMSAGHTAPPADEKPPHY
ncbi:MAG: SlyX family protein [Gammaproteobacteria bacterium]|jgi:SlyX protein|nr:SlyX family protein [Gammaproteobacteria bacterium]